MLYTLAQAKDPQSLVDLVNGLIKKGYKPHGSLCVIGEVSPYLDNCMYVQAMVKRFEENKDANEPQSRTQ
ncbi:MAG TPA: hypothetical protein VD835_14285 [Pyrinomonadaceae bacterium]|nr:hypothetical protein [Pyrinomonadaceae bacterium]